MPGVLRDTMTRRCATPHMTHMITSHMSSRCTFVKRACKHREEEDQSPTRRGERRGQPGRTRALQQTPSATNPPHPAIPKRCWKRCRKLLSFYGQRCFYGQIFKQNIWLVCVTQGGHTAIPCYPATLLASAFRGGGVPLMPFLATLLC